MKNFSALTKSGTSYEARDGVLTIVPRNGFPQSFKPTHFSVTDRPLPSVAHLETLQPTDLPELGRCIYIEVEDGWRLSTQVAKVEVAPE